MNTRNRDRLLSTVAVVAMTTLLLASSTAHSAIVVRSTGSSNDTDTGTATNTVSGFTVDPRTGGKLVLTASWESGDTTIGATWNGSEAFTVAENSAGGRNSAILYLDNPTPGTGNIVVTYGANTASRVGVANITGAATGVDDTSTTVGTSGSLTTTVPNTFVTGVYTTNDNSGGITGPFANTLYSGNSGSSRGNAGYQNEASAGLKNYSWTVTSPDSDNNALAGFVEAAPAPSIDVLNSDSQIVIGPKTSTLSFDAGATADKLVVQVSSEKSGEGFSITYNGEALTLAPGTASGRNQGIYYLDNPFTGGAADLVVDMSGVDTVNGIGLGVVSISGSADGVAATASSATSSVSITPTVDGSFIMAGWGAQGNAGNGAADAPLTELYGGNIGSADGSAGYINDVVALSQSYSFLGGNSPFGSGAAAFAPFIPAPEPGSFILTALGVIGLVGVRRRRNR